MAKKDQQSWASQPARPCHWRFLGAPRGKGCLIQLRNAFSTMEGQRCRATSTEGGLIAKLQSRKEQINRNCCRPWEVSCSSACAWFQVSTTCQLFYSLNTTTEIWLKKQILTRQASVGIDRCHCQQGGGKKQTPDFVPKMASNLIRPRFKLFT